MNSVTLGTAWAMSNKNTFTIPPIAAFVERHLAGAAVIVDPFANNCKLGTITNDLNPEFDTTYHLDALVFLRLLPDECADVVLYDPPYSTRQASECYKSHGKEKLTALVTNARYWAACKDEVARITKPRGKVLTFGWNSNGCGKKRGLEKIEVLLVAHGGAKNDTICTAEIKTQPQLNFNQKQENQ